MSKYVIKNCPNYWYINRAIPECGLTYKVSGFKGETETSEYCKDVDNCLLKQIVEECREEIKPICQIPDGCCGMKNIYSDSKEFAEKLLSYLDIEEVNE